MDNNNTFGKAPNKHIACSVCSCEHNCKDDGYCSLETVRIGTHEANPTVCQCVDCESFKLSKEQQNKTNG